MDLRRRRVARGVPLVRYRGFLGPSAPWLDDEDGELFAESSYEDSLRAYARSLAQSLHSRGDRLLVHPTIERIRNELRLQIAEAAIYGDLYAARQLFDLAEAVEFEHAQAEEAARKGDV